ncbi:MBL fold metallo-hydrolase [Propionimicrobium sp. PCR01-08-3]|uniref:MBL fold metallo-hydrolase n=1 Tax=Propionimicrobium sp. PCR01-08-3 TaxID=3052086 RepID=UPI00255CC794|nr:MBL fold metallo-hydrolase [Propionimicrobium sp. PCR01-08-3]WIY83333.1 MBL fold metallo-hydrolase [Propionimicrobium sp. PCR01-08-3]
MSIRVDHAIAEGTFSLDGETYDVENNVWVLGDETQCVVFDAPHSIDAVRDLVGERECIGMLLTHAHDDHIRYVPDLAAVFDAPVLLNPADKPVWDLTLPGIEWDDDIADGDTFTVGGAEIRAIVTPGHTPGSTCFYVPAVGVLFSGDTLFEGGPGATGRSFSSREQIERSIKEKLFVLPADTVVHTGHGADTTIGAEIEHATGDWM